MPNNKIDIVTQDLQIGQVKVITSDAGKQVNEIELLLGDSTKATMKLDTNLNVVRLIIQDTTLADIPSLDCNISRESLYDFMSGIKKMFNCLEKE